MTVTMVANPYYPISDTPNNKINTLILKQELEDAGMSVTVGNVVTAGSNVQIQLLGLVLAADVTLMDAVIAAHQGADFATVPLKQYEEDETDDDSGDPILKCELVCSPLPEGNYMIGWHMLHKLNANSDTSGSRATLTMIKNGGAENEISRDSCVIQEYQLFGSALSVEVKAGENPHQMKRKAEIHGHKMPVMMSGGAREQQYKLFLPGTQQRSISSRSKKKLSLTKFGRGCITTSKR